MNKLNENQVESIVNTAIMQYETTFHYLYSNGFCFYGIRRFPTFNSDFTNRIKGSLRKRGVLQ